MILVFGTAISGCLGLLTLFVGYAFSGWARSEPLLTRLSLASICGLGWLIAGVSIVGALMPLAWPAALIIWSPALVTWLLPRVRRLLLDDIKTMVRLPTAYGALVGMLLFWGCLLLPFIVYPDLRFFEGTSNHDNFFWLASADFLQGNSYLNHAGENIDFPRFNMVDAITGKLPAWGRMGAEGLIAIASSTIGLSPLHSYNFVVCALVLPWLLIVLSTARRMGAPRMHPWTLIVVCFAQPILAFFVANGNLPNLLGTIFGGGLWLAALEIAERDRVDRIWPFAVAGILCVHGMLCCYPEVFPFAAMPIGMLVVWLLWTRGRPALRTFAILSGVFIGGVLMNPVTTQRAWYGFWTSFGTARKDAVWANLFHQIDFTGYLPGLFTLSIPSVAVYGTLGGLVLTVFLLIALVWTGRRLPAPALIPISLTGFALLLGYTIATSFNYGWQKTAQFSGIQLSVLFPTLAAATLAAGKAGAFARWSRRLVFCVVMGLMLHATLGLTADNLKWAGRKGLTGNQLAFESKLRAEFGNAPVVVDSMTFWSPFFHGMWTPRLFAHHPIVFAPRDKDAGGYLRTSVRILTPPYPPTGLFYVGAEWGSMFNFGAAPLLTDRVGAVYRHHNFITEAAGFFPATGTPEWTEQEFSFTFLPYADGWIDFTLRPSLPPDGVCELEGSVSIGEKATRINARLDSSGLLRFRVPVVAGQANRFSARVSHPPPVDATGDRVRFPFRVEKITSRLDPAPLSPVDGEIDFSEKGNSHLFLLLGFAPAIGEHTWTNQPHPLLRFKAPPAESDLELEVEATPFLIKGLVQTQPTQLRFNGHLLFAAPFHEPGVLRARILREQWNERSTATIQIFLPSASAAETARDDGKPLGLAIHRLTVRPAKTPRP